jgi:hypothetical protein
LGAPDGDDLAAHHFFDLCKEKMGPSSAFRHYLMWIKVFAAPHS